MAPPRRRRKRRPSRVVGAPVSVPEPEPAPPPRRGLLATLMGPPRTGQPVRRVAPPVVTGPPWTRADYYVLSALTAGVIVVVGLFLAVTTGLSVSSTVQASPTPSSTSFAVASNAGEFYPGQPISVGTQEATLQSVSGARLNLVSPLNAAPGKNTPVSQSLALPFTLTAAAAVAASPAPTTTTFSIVNGDNASFFLAGSSISVGGQSDTVKSEAGSKITLDTALSTPPAPNTPVNLTAPNPGGLLTGILQLVADELAIVILPIAAFVARPMAVRLRRKPRPRAWETIFFGAAIWVVDTLVLELLFSTVAPTDLGPYILTLVVAIASGFVVLPFIYPVLARFLRPRPRVPAAGSR